MLFSSCQSNKALVLEGENYDRAVMAIQQLGDDMLSSMEINIPITALADYLPDSYRAYEPYVPLYSELRDDYLDKVASIAKDALSGLYDGIYDEIVTLSDMPEDFLYGDTSLTLAVRNNMRESLISGFFRILLDYSDELSSAFETSRNEFASIRNAYINLQEVGINRDLPVADGVLLYGVSSVAVDSLFDGLAEAERTLKNKIVDRSSDSLYSIFWEAR